MEYIRDIYARKMASGEPVISLEFFPPKTEEGERSFFEKSVPALAALKPDYCSVTYGAGGSTRDKTLSIVERIQREHRLTTMMHLTCVSSTATQIGEVLADAKNRGIKNILALRGDPPNGSSEFQKTEGGFEFSFQLIEYIRSKDGFSIGAAGFPEGHIACKAGKYADWNHLKKKADAGAEFILTQLFFSNDDFFEFRDYVRKLGVTIPIIPGIIPIQSAAQIKRFTSLCGAKLSAELLSDLEKYADNDEACMEFGIDYATRQCKQLLSCGAPGLHFYTLNKARSTTGVLKNLGFVK